MSRFNEYQGFSLEVFLRQIVYVAMLLLLTWVLGLWRWKPKDYGCFSGWTDRFSKVEIIDHSSLHLYLWSIKQGCEGGDSDKYDPKVYKKI